MNTPSTTEQDKEQVTTEQSPIVSKIEELLNEEKWTRSMIENYSIKNFTAFDEILTSAKTEKLLTQIYELCQNHLHNNSKSIIGMYVSGIIALEEELLDETTLYTLINLFKENKKWGIVEYLAKKILNYNEDIVALNNLKSVYEYTGNEEELHEIWKKIVKIDYDNGEVSKKLGELCEKENNKEQAIFYFKLALRRFTKKYVYNAIEELWIKLTELIPEDLEFFFSIEKEIAKKDVERAATFLSLLTPYFIDKGDYENAITILKKILVFLPKDKDARNLLIDCYKFKYKDHSLLNEYLKKSAITQSWKKIDDAISTFERHIVFDKGNFVYHRSWGIGKIIQCQHESFLIDFETKRNHTMSLQMALTSLKVLPEDHLKVQKLVNLDKLKKDDDQSIKNILVSIFKSYNGQASMKEIKSEMTSIIGEENWNKWWTKAKKIIKVESIFGTIPENKNIYMLRDKPLSLEEELYEQFNNHQSFEDKLSVMLEYLKHETDRSNEVFGQMLSFFLDHVNKEDTTITTVKSYFLLRRIKRIEKQSAIVKGLEVKLPTEKFLKAKKDFVNIYDSFSDLEIKKDFLHVIRKEDPLWHIAFLEILTELKPTKLHNEILEDLFEIEDKKPLIKRLTKMSDDVRLNPETYIWLFRIFFLTEELIPLVKKHFTDMGTKDFFELLNIDADTVIFNSFKLLDILSREIENNKEKTNNKRIFNSLVDAFLKEDIFERYINETSEIVAKKCIALVKGIYELDEKSRRQFILIAQKKFPNISIIEDSARTTRDDNIMLVTKRSFEEKQRELQHLVTVEIPKNSKDIGIAQALGDLRENAEYISAMDYQKILQETVRKLTEELKLVKVVVPEEVDPSIICFGTDVELTNIDTNKKEKYTLLGEWESNPEKKIISYRSPLGATLLGHKLKDKIKFHYGSNEKRYQINNIKIAKF